ncbi:outer membrane protein assembly factor BamC [Methylomonas sp. AM2-LC]|uniref:outer membrane protein assembly factor BamC n=1 Tax=Methylomonas sp. AM2-LC TaxID=3153301 RepID=UPI003266D463
MYKQFLYSLPWFLLVACSSAGPDKYKDTKNLEFPPTLAIEHSANQSSYSSSNSKLPDFPPVKNKDEEKSDDTQKEDSTDKVAEKAVSKPTDKPVNADLARLVLLIGSEKKPIVELKTGFERAWILVGDALSAADIEVANTDYDAGVFRVRYVAQGEGKGRGLINSVTSFFSDEFKDTEYTLTVDKDKKITDVHVDKVVSADSGKDTFNNDDSAALMKLVHKTIIANLEK